MKLSRLSIIYRTVQKLSAAAVFLLFTSSAGFASASLPVIVVALGLVFATLAFTVGYEYLYWKNFDYRIEPEGLKIVSGVITKNDRDIPLKRIQNVDVNRSIAQRFLGIAQVDIETAGGGQTEASLKYLDYENAKDLQQQVRQLKNRRTSDKSQGSNEKRSGFELSNRDLSIMSLISADMRVIGGLGLILSVFGGSIASNLEGALSQAAGIAVLGVLGFLLLSAVWISGAASKFVRYYGFRLYFHENALEYERGLFNRSSGTIPEEKIQDILVEENLIQRYLGYATLKVETAGYSGTEQHLDTGAETVIPLAKRSEVEKFANEIFNHSSPEFEKIHEKVRKRYFRRYIFAGLILTFPALAASITFGFHPLIALPGLLVLLSARKAAELKWQNIGFYLDENYLFTRKGFWNRKTYIVPYFRVQNLMLTQSLFQRRWNQKSLVVDTAGSVLSYPQIVDMEADDAGKLRDEIFYRFKQSLLR